MMVMLFAASFLIIFIIGLLILPMIGTFIFIISIINTLHTVSDQEYFYPGIIQILDPRPKVCESLGFK